GASPTSRGPQRTCSVFGRIQQGCYNRSVPEPHTDETREDRGSVGQIAPDHEARSSVADDREDADGASTQNGSANGSAQQKTATLTGIGPDVETKPSSLRLSNETPTPRALAMRPRRGQAKQSYRFVRAYWTTFVVLFSYLWFFFLRRILGQSWADSRIGDVH